VRFACSRCGKRYASTDEPVPGRIYAIGCKCGHTIVVKDPATAVGRDGAASSLRRDDPFAGIHSGAIGGGTAPPASGRRPAPGRERPTDAHRSSGAFAAAGAPVRPAAPPPSAAIAPAPPAPGGVPGSASAAAPAARPYDPVAASHGLLLDVDRARALSSGSLTTDSIPLLAAGDDEEVSITFSDRLPLFKRPERPRPWLLGAAAALAALVVLGGAWALLGRSTTTVEGAPTRAPASRETAPSGEAPRAPAPAAPEGPPPGPAARASPPATVPSSRPAARPSSPPRELRPARRPPQAPAAAAAPAPAAASEPSRRPDTAPREGAASAALLDLLSRKEDAPATAEPRAESPSGALPGTEQVELAVRRNRAGFDACSEVGDAAGARLGSRRVVLSVTVNPSGIVTGPRLDDPDLDGSAAGVCIKSAARKLVLPAFNGEPVRVRVPLSLGP